MAIWIATIIIAALMGGVAALLENWARGDAIPNWHIIGVGVAAAVIPAVISVALLGGPLWQAIIVLIIVALLVDRTQDRMKQGL